MLKDQNKSSGYRKYIIGAIILALVVTAIVLAVTDDRNGPPGPAPEGKVWSYEHGHWHNK